MGRIRKLLFNISEATMQGLWHEGDIASGTCASCGKPVSTRFETRSVKLNRSRVTFSDILVGVCTECDATVSVPRQSLAQFRELGSWK